MEFEEVFSGGEDSDFELDENVLRELYRADNGSVKVKPNSIKDELRTKIQHRRVSEGQQELKVVFEPPKSYEVPIQCSVKTHTNTSTWLYLSICMWQASTE